MVTYSPWGLSLVSDSLIIVLSLVFFAWSVLSMASCCKEPESLWDMTTKLFLKRTHFFVYYPQRENKVIAYRIQSSEERQSYIKSAVCTPNIKWLAVTHIILMPSEDSIKSIKKAVRKLEDCIRELSTRERSYALSFHQRKLHGIVALELLSMPTQFNDVLRTIIKQTHPPYILQPFLCNRLYLKYIFTSKQC